MRVRTSGAACLSLGTRQRGTTVEVSKIDFHFMFISAPYLHCSGLSVLAWPAAYFHNYAALLDTFGIESQDVRIRFLVAEAGTGGQAHLLQTDSNDPTSPSPLGSSFFFLLSPSADLLWDLIIM